MLKPKKNLTLTKILYQIPMNNCKYYNITEFNSIQRDSHFLILTLNIRSYNKNIEKLLIFLDT